MKQKMVPIISVVVGILAFWLTNQYLRNQMQHLRRIRDAIYEGSKKVDVVVVRRTLPAGTVLAKEDMMAEPKYESSLDRDDVRAEDMASFFDKKLKYSLEKGERIRWSYVDMPYRPGGGLGNMVKQGMRAISISVSGAAAVSGLVQPNDRVDVLGTFSLPSKGNPAEMESVTLSVLQDVTVLATGARLADQESGAKTRGGERAGGYNMITLEVTPREAELLVFAQTVKGGLTLALRNPADVSFEKDLPEINFGRLEQTLPEINLYRQRNIRHKKDL